MKVLLTGGAGYVGYSVIEELAKEDSVDEVVIYDNFARSNFSLLLSAPTSIRRKVTVRVDDILNSRGLSDAMLDVDCVCHLAALAHSPYSDHMPHAFDQINHWGTAEVVYAAEDAGVSKLVYLSSGAIYGFGGGAFSARSPVMPVTSYGASKLAGERHLDRVVNKVDVVILRAGTVFGLNPMARFDTFVNRFVLDAALGRPIQVHGSGDQRRPLIHVRALARQIRASITGQIEVGKYNAVQENVSVNDVVKAVRKTCARAEVIYINQQQRMRDLALEKEAKLDQHLQDSEMMVRHMDAMFSTIALQ
jgi:UDP-glucose 4-epimerase